MGEYEHINHDFAPVYNEKSRILILGTLPSGKSREMGFYYGHPQNRFWKVLARLFDEAFPETVEERKAMLLRNGVAIWDVAESCDIVGAADSSIKNVVPADVAWLLEETGIKKVYANGALAKKLYDRYTLPRTGIDALQLPSTSPANARFRLEDLIESWKIILESGNRD
ncbi:DNA-deoxyinosine glycosylase [Ihubacter sp. rT4E-8]|uniref:DNA-deoxyinosine glycosylase n=1 Tax=unclassified Ihubacter TaxID=2633299 RepID=UPI0013798CD1